MVKIKHTPGPWKEYAGYVFKPGDDGANICAMSELRANSEIGYTPPELGSVSTKEIHANAVLIAAAPDMLKALKAVVAVADRKTDEFDLARAAIAKAEMT